MSEHMISFANLFITFLVGALGVASSYWVLRSKVENNTTAITELKIWRQIVDGNPDSNSAFMKRLDCIDKHNTLDIKIDLITKQNATQIKTSEGFRNFARYVLAKDNLTLPQIDKIMNGD